MPAQYDRDSDLAKLLQDVAHNLTCKAGEARRLGSYRVHVSSVELAERLFAVQHWDCSMTIKTETGREAVACGPDTCHDAASRALEEDGAVSEHVIVTYVH